MLPFGWKVRLTASCLDALCCQLIHSRNVGWLFTVKSEFRYFAEFLLLESRGVRNKLLVHAHVHQGQLGLQRLGHGLPQSIFVPRVLTHKSVLARITLLVHLRGESFYKTLFHPLDGVACIIESAHGVVRIQHFPKHSLKFVDFKIYTWTRAHSRGCKELVSFGILTTSKS